jgi:hypothetical protein
MFVFSPDDWQYIVKKNSLDTVWYASNPDVDENSISTVMASIADETYLIVADTEEDLIKQINMKNNEPFISKQMTWQTLGSMFRFIFHNDKPRFFAGGNDFRASAILTCPGGEVVPDIFSFICVGQYEDGTYCMKDNAVVAETNPYDLLASINILGLDDKVEHIISMPLMQAAPMFENLWHDDRFHKLGERLVWDPKCIDMVFGLEDPDDMEEKLLKKLKETEK